MKFISLAVLMFLMVSMLIFFPGCWAQAERPHGKTLNTAAGEIILPPPALTGDVSLEKALYTRVSRRNFTNEPLSLAKVGQVLWAAQGVGIDGVTGASRTAPSAGATHPMDIYLVAGNVAGLQPGLYRYEHTAHRLLPVAEGDIRGSMANVALGQRFVAQAPASVILAAEYRRTTQRYGERGIRYVHMEVGHITQNIYLQAEALKLGAVAVGAFRDEELKSLLKIDTDPLMIIPIGNVH
jgi:SagB-type dehydrogenase family enzyme